MFSSGRFVLSASLAFLAASVHGAESTVELRRTGEAPAEALAYFSELDRLLDEADAVALLLGRGARRPTAAMALDAAERVSRMAELYATVTRDRGTAPALAAVAAVRAALAGRRPDSPLPAAALEPVFSAEGESLLRWSELMRQEALAADGPPGAYPANSLLSFQDGEESRELAFLDISGKPPVENGRVVSSALAALVSAAGAAPGNGGCVLGRRRVWLRGMGASLYADLASPADAALLRIRYREPGGATPEQARFYFLTRALYELGFAVSVRNGELVAVVGGESRGLDPWERRELFAAAWRALETAAGMTDALGDFLAGTVSSDENALRLDALARVFAAEGRLPFAAGKMPDRLRTGLESYRKREPERESLRGEMDRSLAGFGFSGFPASAPVGQRTIDLHFNAKIDAGLARGELKLEKAAPVRDASYDPLRQLASAKASAGTARIADRALARASVIGLVGREQALRAQWRLDDERWLIVYATRDPAGAARELAYEGRRGERPKTVGVEEAAGRLEEAGIPVLASKVFPVEAAGAARVADARGVFFGELLHPGPGIAFIARVTFDPAKALLGDRIFATPYVAASDRKAVRRSRALLTTAGGTQAAALAVLAGVPALDLPSGAWSESAGLSLDLPVLGPQRTVPGGTVRSVLERRVLTLREGEAVRLDPRLGAVEYLEPARQEILLRMEEALRAYDRGGDINALALWTAGQLSAGGLKGDEKVRFSRSLLDELERRRAAGFSPEHLERIRRVIRENS